MKNDRVALIVNSDLHTNSTVAVCQPSINLDDGGTYRASKTQRWLWSEWTRAVQWALDLTQGYRRVAVFNGDLGELDAKRRSTQLITTNKATIIEIVQATISPLVDAVDKLLFIRGTMAHTGRSQWLEETIAADYDHSITNDTHASHYHYRGMAAGVRVDLAHHVSMGGIPWTEKNAAMKAATIALWRYRIDRKAEPPALLIRSHNHRYADSGGNYEVDAYCMPAWTVLTEYGYRIGAENSLADIGMLVFLCEDGQYQMHRYRAEIPGERRLWANQI